MTEQLELYDVTIIGGGPAGMYTAFYSGMRNLKTKLIEAKDELGGRMLLYREKIVWDVGGVAPIVCEKLIAQFADQARTFDPTLVFGQQIIGLEQQADSTYILKASTGEKHWTRTVIVAVGRGFLRLAKLELEGAERYEASNLHYTVQEPERFRGKRVLISGGGKSAVDLANELVTVAAQVTVVHKLDRFDGQEHNVVRMKESSAEVLTPYEVTQLYSGNGKTIERVTITHVESGDTRGLEVDEVIVNHGLVSDVSGIMNWGLDTRAANVIVSPRLETNLPGIFGAGECASYDSKLNLIAGAISDAALALNSAKRYMDPDAPKMAKLSTFNEVFKERNKALGLSEG